MGTATKNEEAAQKRNQIEGILGKTIVTISRKIIHRCRKVKTECQIMTEFLGFPRQGPAVFWSKYFQVVLDLLLVFPQKITEDTMTSQCKLKNLSNKSALEGSSIYLSHMLYIIRLRCVDMVLFPGFSFSLRNKTSSMYVCIACCAMTDFCVCFQCTAFFCSLKHH